MFPLVNRMIQVPDAASIGTMRAFAGLLGTKPGGSTGTGLYGALRVLRTAREKREHGGVVTLLCDSGDRYGDTYYNDQWLQEQKIDYKPWQAAVEHFLHTGVWTPPSGAAGQARR
jgi:cysteine synthase A